jgi:hypothetical protein
MSTALPPDDLKRLLGILQGVSRGLIDVNQTLRRIASALEGRSGSPALGGDVWPGREERGPGLVVTPCSEGDAR